MTMLYDVKAQRHFESIRVMVQDGENWRGHITEERILPYAMQNVDGPASSIHT